MATDQAHAVSVAFGGEDAAFTDDWRGEAVRLLRQVADAIERGDLSPGQELWLRDSNGNTIGKAFVSR